MLIAPLNWGLGHATRCIPIIDALIQANFEPVLASDGQALALLRREFPNLKSYELPSYNIKYASKGYFLNVYLLFQAPKIMRAVRREHSFINGLIHKENLSGIISDNRFGVYSNKVPSVYITHQLHVLSGFFTFLSTHIHKKIIKKHNACWVPDLSNDQNYSGVLGQSKRSSIRLDYLGIMSRFQYKKTEKIYDLTIVLSGPEPQRSLLESKLESELRAFNGRALVVRGLLEVSRTINWNENFEVVNFMDAKKLETALNQSVLVISRSGYSSIMDLAVLRKKVLFIPTPGQKEQEYLAKRMERRGSAPYCKQKDFSIQQLERIKRYNGLYNDPVSFPLSLFELFESE